MLRVIRYLLDSNMAIYAMIDADGTVTQRIAAFAPGELVISAISLAEIAVGIKAQKPPPPEVLKAFVEAVPIVAFDEGAARAYAALPFRRGRFDQLLAAHALSLGAVFVTNNEADFVDVPGLVVENWTI